MYPKLTKENKIAGLELMDLLVLATIYLIVFIFLKNLIINLALLLAAYFFLRLYKRNKPSRYTQTLFRFLILPSRFTQSREVSK